MPRQLWYHIKVAFHHLFWMPAIAMVGSFIMLRLARAASELRFGYMLIVMEVLAPPLDALLSTAIISRENSEGTLELAIAKVSLLRLFSLRFALVQAYMGLTILVVTFLFKQCYIAFDAFEIWFASFVSSFFLACLGSTLANLSVNSNVGYIGAIAWWAVNLILQGLAQHPWFRYIYLFSRTFSFEESIWTANKLTLLIACVCLLGLNYLALRHPERFVLQRL